VDTSLALTPEQEVQALELHKAAIKIDACVQIYDDGDFWTMEPEALTGLLHTVAHPLDRHYQAIQAIKHWHDLCREHPDRLRLALSSGDILDAAAAKKTAIILGFQSPKPIEDDLGNLELFWKLGLRVLQLAYNGRSYFADGSGEPDNAGLSYLGRLAVEEMNRLGMLIDLSHVGERSSCEAAQLSRDPVICSHSNPRAVSDNPRNISDTEIKLIAQGGGVIGASAWGPICWRDKSRGRPTIEDFFAQVDYLVNVAGIDHVGVGTDTASGTETGETNWYVRRFPSIVTDYNELVESDTNSPRRYASDLDNIAHWPNITKGLLARGFAAGDIRKILGGNFLRVFAQVWDRAR
jgi:membrane dipeptidase